MLFEPDDIFTQDVASLATTATALPGLGNGVGVCGPGFAGVQFSRLGAVNNDRWFSLAPGRMLKLSQRGSMALRRGPSTIRAGGTLTIEVYRPERGQSLDELAESLRPIALGYSGLDSAIGSPLVSPSNDDLGPSFASVVAGAQMTQGVLAAGGATQACQVIVVGDGGNAKPIFFAATQADAAGGAAGTLASKATPVYASGDDAIIVPIGGKLWQAAADTLQKGYFRVRS